MSSHYNSNQLKWSANFLESKNCHSGEKGEFGESCMTMLRTGYDGIAVVDLCFSFQRKYLEIE